MADQNEPKKETVRITLPPRPAGQPPAPSSGRDTVRINMPARAPGSGTALRPPTPPGAAAPRPPTSQTLVPPAPSKPVAPPPVFRKNPPLPPSASPSGAPGAARVMPQPPTVAPTAPAPAATNFASAPSPKKETARIALLPDPPARPAHKVEMKKTQPLSMMPESSPPVVPIASAPVSVASIASSEGFIEELPMAFCWALLVAAIVILTIQIWNYVS
jgi:hypothetical protein